MAAAFYRGYWSGGKRAGQVQRFHIIREDGTRSIPPGHQALCGQGAWPASHSDPVIADPLPDKPPEGLTWCPKCVGLLADRLGLLDVIASSLAAYGLHLTEDLWRKRSTEEEHFRALRREALAARGIQ